MAIKTTIEKNRTAIAVGFAVVAVAVVTTMIVRGGKAKR